MPLSVRFCKLPNQCLHHDHDFHQLVIGIRGCAEFEIAGQGGRVSPLNGCLVPAADTHYYEGIGDNHHLIVDVPHREVQQAGYERLAPLFERPRYFTIDARLQLLFNYTVQELEYYAGDPQVAAQLALPLLDGLARRLTAAAPQQPVLSRTLDLGALDAYIRQHLAEKITVEQLARQACMSASHFHTLFRRTTGMSPYQYLLRTRLQQARRLLLESRLPLAEIAHLTGFANQSALSNAVKKHFQTTPRQLRRMANAGA